MNLSDSDSAAPYFAQMASVNANCVERWRRQITTATSDGSSPYPFLFPVKKLSANRIAEAAASGDTESKNSRCLPGIWSYQSSFASRAGCQRVSGGAAAGAGRDSWASADESPRPKTAAAAAKRARNERRAVMGLMITP